MGQDDPAPALGRGLALVRILDREGPLSLERLTELAGWPKTSMLRLLTSLCRNGVAERDPASRRYRLRERLLPVGGGRLLRRAWDALVTTVPADYPHTLELHAWDGERLTMIDRRDPEVGELRVQARIGFRRDLAEFDALTQVVVAFGGVPVSGERWYYVDGRQHPIPAQRRLAVVADVIASGRAADLSPNSNGVVRSARAVRDGDRLLGILAAAQVARDGSEADPVPDLPDLT